MESLSLLGFAAVLKPVLPERCDVHLKLFERELNLESLSNEMLLILFVTLILFVNLMYKCTCEHTHAHTHT